MSVTIQIKAARGTTTYEFEAHHNEGVKTDYPNAQRDAEDFERWLNQQPERQALNDTQQRSTQ